MSLFSKMNMAKCPACKKGKLYKGLLKVNDRCSECGFEIGKHDAADGPAFFATIFVGTVICVLAAIVEIKYSPPIWVHFALWIPLLIISSILSLRFFKTILIKIQFKIRGRDGWDHVA